MPKLRTREGAMGVHGIAHMAEIDDVAFIPEAGHGGGRCVCFRVDLTGLGADHGAAALCLGATVRCLGARLVRTCAQAMGHLVEAVFHGFRPNPYWL